MRYFSILILATLTFIACKKNNPQKVIKARTFDMGFSSKSFGTEESQQNQTYDTIQKYGDIYLEKITSSIPWDVLIDNTSSNLPEYIAKEVNYKASKKNGDKLILGFNLLNKDRTHLQTDYNGNFPNVNSINDPSIVNAYFKYISYYIIRLTPQYVILSMDSNELLFKNKSIWSEYKALLTKIRIKAKNQFPEIKFSQSVSLHYWENPPVQDFAAYNAEIQGLYNGYDFAAISYYPYFNDQHDRKSFQKSFDFLKDHIEIPIAIVETGHIANNLIDSDINNTESNEDEQENYLNTLLINAHNNEYDFVIWNIHQDYDLFWEALPDWTQASSKVYRDTGLKDETGLDRKVFKTWKEILIN
jgi:hypothetical protein